MRGDGEDLRELEREEAAGELLAALSALPKHRLVELQKTIAQVRELKYPRRSEPRYGNLARAMSWEQTRNLFAAAPLRSRRAFAVMLVYGLRASEVADALVLPEHGLLRIQNRKARRVDHLPLLAGSEWMFRGTRPRYEALRLDFRRAADRARLDLDYGSTGTGRTLFQFTTHSLRHTGVSWVERAARDPAVAAAYARHSKERRFGTTGRYIHVDADRVRGAMASAFAPLLRALLDFEADVARERDDACGDGSRDRFITHEPRRADDEAERL